MSRLVTAVVVGVACAVPVRARWLNWRGPASTGVSPEEGLPVEWGDARAIAWKSPVRGLGISSPIVAGNLVVVTSQAGSGEVRSGPRLVQGANAADAGERALGAGPRAGEGRAAFVVTALDRMTGRRAWEYELSAEGPLPFVHEK